MHDVLYGNCSIDRNKSDSEYFTMQPAYLRDSTGKISTPKLHNPRQGRRVRFIERRGVYKLIKTTLLSGNRLLCERFYKRGLPERLCASSRRAIEARKISLSH